MQNNTINFINHNESAWDKQALAQNQWSQPVNSKEVQKAKEGQWEILLTPTPLDKAWLGDIKNKKILCLASAGGQQAPILAAAGADVTVFDLSREQLNQDDFVAKRDHLSLTTVQGDMTDLGRFSNESFDIIFHPISNHYVADVNPVWRECYRVLKKGGILLASFFNPVVFVADRNPQDMAEGIIRPRFTIPYSDINDLSKKEMEIKMTNGEAFVFGHTLADLIGGQLNAGFLISNYTEDMQPHPRFLIDKYLPTFLATRAVKL